MINLLFIDNLPLSLVLIYLIVGIYLTFMSFDIGYEEFDVKKMPKWLVLSLGLDNFRQDYFLIRLRF